MAFASANSADEMHGAAARGSRLPGVPPPTVFLLRPVEVTIGLAGLS
ncbi:hypothetical protein [Frankia sp. EAN1pec]